MKNGSVYTPQSTLAKHLVEDIKLDFRFIRNNKYVKDAFMSLLDIINNIVSN